MPSFYPLLLDVQTNYWTYVSPFMGPIMGAGTAYLMMRLNQRNSESTKQKEVREKAELAAVVAESDWKAARVKEEEHFRECIRKHEELVRLHGQRIMNTIKTLRDNLGAAERQRLQDKLKRETDLAIITGILKEGTDAQSQMTTIVANMGSLKSTSERHDRELEAVRTSLDSMNTHILDLAKSQTPCP